MLNGTLGVDENLPAARVEKPLAKLDRDALSSGRFLGLVKVHKIEASKS